MSGDQPTNKEIIEAIQVFSTNVDGQLSQIRGQTNGFLILKPISHSLPKKRTAKWSR